MFTTPSSTAPKQLFLVVEPDPLFRLLLCATAASRFSDFHAVGTYDEAQTLLAAHTFAAIVAEYHLPGRSGLALYEEARRIQPVMPFVLICGGMQVTLSDPQFRFLPKPFSLAELDEALDAMRAPMHRS